MSKNEHYTQKIMEVVERKKQQPSMSYEDMYKQMDKIAVVNQMKTNYYGYKRSGYSNEVAFQFAKKQTYEDYLQYMVDIIITKKFSNFKNVKEIKIGLEILKNEPQELYEYLDVAKYFDNKKAES